MVKEIIIKLYIYTPDTYIVEPRTSSLTWGVWNPTKKIIDKKQDKFKYRLGYETSTFYMFLFFFEIATWAR